MGGRVRAIRAPPPSAVILFPIVFRIFPHRLRVLALTCVVLFVVCLYRTQSTASVDASPSEVERGRMVYVSQDCTRCHTQGPQRSTEDMANRSPGPDLSDVGARRSALWLKMHLYNPRQVSGSSIMPSYAFLFRDRRGNDLVAYLAGLGSPATHQHIADEQQWHLSPEALASASPADGPQLYNRYCATCHNANGRTRLRWQSEFIESPAILAAGAITGDVQGDATPTPESTRIDHLAQIIKFGLPASDMAGHERLSDKDIASLSSWLAQNATQPGHKP
jgi:cbb3-type cytochrome oxidase cytochrome c subunit